MPDLVTYGYAYLVIVAMISFMFSLGLVSVLDRDPTPPVS